MGKIFLTSDLHFGHQREFLYGPRGFNTIQEHDEAGMKLSKKMMMYMFLVI